MSRYDTSPTTELTAVADGGVQAIIDAARASVDPFPLELDRVYAIRDRNGAMTTLDLTGDQYRTVPALKKADVRVWDAPSFLKYYEKHHDAGTDLYADVQQLSVHAVLDAHTVDGARWAAHHLRLELRQTKVWQAWVGGDGQMQEQEAFAEFIEEHLPELVSPSGAEMLEIAQTLQTSSKNEFKSSTRLGSGLRQFEFTESQTSAKAGMRGQFTIPETFTIGVIPFEGSETYRMNARFRYRISDSKLRLGYRLDRPEDVVKAAFGDVLTALGADIEEPIMAGSPRA